MGLYSLERAATELTSSGFQNRHATTTSQGEAALLHRSPFSNRPSGEIGERRFSWDVLLGGWVVGRIAVGAQRLLAGSEKIFLSDITGEVLTVEILAQSLRDTRECQ